MNRFFILTLMAFAIFLNSCKQTPSQPVISINEVWSRPVIVENAHLEPGSQPEADPEKPHQMPGMGITGVAYLTLVNGGGAPDRLLNVKTEVCEIVEIHLTENVDGKMTMMKVDGGLEIPPGEKLELKPGAHHLMLINMKRSLRAGEHFQMTLEFEKSGLKTITSEVRDY